MDRELLESVVEDCVDLARAGTAPDLAALQIAIVIEDLVGIRLSDSEIDFELLSRPDAIAEIVTRHTGGT